VSTEAPVAALAHQRLIDAMAASIAERGYRASTVADVVRIARTSRRTFYEHFADRDACFLALFEQTTSHTLEQIAGAADPGAPWEEQVDAALDAYIDAVTEHPELQQSFVRELPGLGASGAEQQRLVIERFAQALVTLVEQARRAQPEVLARPLPLDVAIIVVGGLRELLVISIQRRRDLHELRASAGQVVKAIIASIVL
jgi:AcrR family transcriptional regulator